jgi:repressor LexA
MLTRQQAAVLDLIRTGLERDGYAPSYEEMMRALNLRSKSGIFRLVQGLEERGFVRRGGGHCRNLVVVAQPPGHPRPPPPPPPLAEDMRLITGALLAAWRDAVARGLRGDDPLREELAEAFRAARRLEDAMAPQRGDGTAAAGQGRDLPA